jgi:ABC-type nitrate/sulfonate/bicarbonate transport system ATPase subunit
MAYTPTVKVVLDKICVAFGAKPVLLDVDLAIPEAASVAIVGQSGVGKTTLLRIIAGLLRPDKGSVLVNGLAPRQHYGKGRIGFLFQEACLFPHLTLRQNIELAFRAHRQPIQSEQVSTQLSTAGLTSAADLFPFQASVGMKARTAIARTLSFPPGLLLMDEPFTALDPVRRTELNRLVRQTCSRIGTTRVWTTHNVAEALVFADIIVALGPARTIGLFSTKHLPEITDDGNLPGAAREMRDAIIASTWQSSFAKTA